MTSPKPKAGAMDFEARAEHILRCVHEEKTMDSQDRDMIAKALREAAADAYEDAANRCGIVGYKQSASSLVEYFMAKASKLRRPASGEGA